MSTIEFAASRKRTSPLNIALDWRTWVVVLVVASVTPFLVQHLINLWRYRPHYEFAPVALAAFVWLAWRRWPQWVRHDWASRVAGWTLLVLGLACLAAALTLYSPWVGAIAAVLAAGGLLFLLAGRGAFSELLPVWLLLWLVVPPPFRLDYELIRLLQGVTARSTSLLIELGGVYHLLEGNVFRLPGRELFVAEACSGIHSQLVLIAASILLVIAIRRSWIHAILLVALSICLSTIVNIVRVTVIVLVAARWDLDWSVGWQHEVLGYSLVLIGFLLLISADLLLAGLLAPVLDISKVEEELTQVEMPLAKDPLSVVWNRLVACVTQADLAAYAEQSDLSTTTATDAGEPEIEQEPVGCQPSCGMLLLVATAFGCLSVIQVLILIWVPAAPELSFETTDTQSREDWLPASFANWQRTEYKLEEREAGSDAGQFSHVWIYESEDQITKISADFPYLGWHELTRCYTSIGWIEVSRKVWRDDKSGPYVEVFVRKPAGEVGQLCFSLLDGSGHPIEPRASHWTGLRGKIERSPVWTLFGRGEHQVVSTETTIQFQQFLVSQVRMDDDRRRETRKSYLDFRRRFLKRGWGGRKEG